MRNKDEMKESVIKKKKFKNNELKYKTREYN